MVTSEAKSAATRNIAISHPREGFLRLSYSIAPQPPSFSRPSVAAPPENTGSISATRSPAGAPHPGGADHLALHAHRWVRILLGCSPHLHGVLHGVSAARAPSA